MYMTIDVNRIPDEIGDSHIHNSIRSSSTIPLDDKGSLVVTKRGVFDRDGHEMRLVEIAPGSTSSALWWRWSSSPCGWTTRSA